MTAEEVGEREIHHRMSAVYGKHSMPSVADGEFEIWGGQDLMRDCITCIYKNTEIIICTAKSLVDLFSLQIYQLIHQAMWVDLSVVS